MGGSSGDSSGGSSRTTHGELRRGSRNSAGIRGTNSRNRKGSKNLGCTGTARHGCIRKHCKLQSRLGYLDLTINYKRGSEISASEWVEATVDECW